MKLISPSINLIRFFSLSLHLITAVAILISLQASADPRSGRRLRPSADEQAVVEMANPGLLDPIGPSERNKGKQIADNSNKVKSARQVTGRRAKPRGLQNLDNVQFLYMERHDEGKNADPRSRKADVNYFDYSTNQAIKVVVDLNNSTVSETSVSQGPARQPYFTRAEVTAAMQLIFDHPQMGPVLRKAYQEIAGQPLLDVSQLDAQGGLYFPDNQSKLGRMAANCATQRCMQLFIPVDDAHFIDATNLVVNLSSGDLLWVNQGIAGHSH